MAPAPEQGARGTHLRRRDLGLWEHAPAQEPRDFLRIDAVVFRLAAMHGLHGEGMPEDKGDTFASAQGSQPRPRADACDRDDHSVTIRRNDLEEGRGVGGEVLLYHALPMVMQDADVQRPGMESDSTVRLMLFGVESPRVSSSMNGFGF
jgi:hypothetical protein